MASTTRRRAANQDLPRQPSLISASSLSPLMADNAAAAGSINMDEILKNFYPETTPSSSSNPDANANANANANHNPPSDPAPDPPPPLFHSAGNDADKTVDDVWKEIVAGAARQHPSDGGRDQQVTLEDFLMKAAVGPPVEAAATAAPGPGAVPSVMVNGSLIQPQGQLGVPVGAGGGGGRGKRRAALHEEPPVDKATQQKQRRMIKNRESAARSRERKQAYTAELENLVTQLEEENAQLLREEAELNKEKCEKLVEIVVPVTEGRRPPRDLRRVQSM
ncbi:hypothetical protein CRG98_033641 [Punica granatum]|nr:hypothetical protein CRG98_033641 [Punica granatum]